MNLNGHKINLIEKLINDSNKLITSKSPFKQFKNSFTNYFDCRKIDNIFEDFSEYHFTEQTHLIHEEIHNALIRKEYPILIRSIYNFRVINIFIFLSLPKVI
jgi:hypothetical protein